MADISEYIDEIQNAVYGEEVRSSIINSLEAINYEVNKEAYTVTLAEEGWEEDSDGYLVQTVENEHITDHSTVLVAMQTTAAGLNLEAAANYSNIYHATVNDGYIKFYILEPASADVPINYVLISSNSGKVFITGSGITGSGGQLVLRGINVIHMPTKTVYRKGETISKAGLLVKARYNNGSVADVTAQCVWSTETAQSTAGTQTITLTYTEDEVTTTTTLDITVYELASIAITTQPTNRTYKRGATIDTSGMVVTATYTTGTTAVVTNDCALSATTAQSTAGTQTIVVSYTEDSVTKTATFDITVYALASIALTSQPAKNIYYEGDSIVTSGMTVTATYTDGHTANVTSSSTVSPSAAPSGVMSSDVTVSYTEDGISKTTSYGITIYEFDATITVNTKAGASVTAIGSATGATYTGTADSNGMLTLSVHYSDTYNITAIYGQMTGSASITVNDQETEYAKEICVNPAWKTLAFQGRTVLKTDDGIHYTELSTLPSYPGSPFRCYYYHDGIVFVVRTSTNHNIGFVYSEDGGVNWTDISTDLGYNNEYPAGIKKLNNYYYVFGSAYTNNDTQRYGVYCRFEKPSGTVQSGVRVLGPLDAYFRDYETDGLNYKGVQGKNVGTSSDNTSFNSLLSNIEYGNGVWVLTTLGNEIYYSEDGTTWELATLPCEVTVSYEFGNLNFIGNKFIFVDMYGRILTSSDGKSWIAVNDTPVFGTTGIKAAIGASSAIILFKNNQIYARVSNNLTNLGEVVETDLDSSKEIPALLMLEST